MEERENHTNDLALSNGASTRKVTEMSVPRSNLTLADDTRLKENTGGAILHRIDDITGRSTFKFSERERLLRCKLASLYRLVDIYGWSQQIFNHITVKVDNDREHFLINQFGLTYREVTAGNLIKIDLEGDVVDKGCSNEYRVNKAGFVIHSAIHGARPEINCVIHVHLPDVIAVSAMDCGLLLLSQESCIVGNVSYHDYQGIAVDEKEKEDIVKDLGPVNKVMILKNHGMVACGRSIEEAYFYLINTISACQTQVKILSCVKLKDLKVLDKSIMEAAQNVVEDDNTNMVSDKNMVRSVKDMVFESEMRMLDDMGYNTGYVYADQKIKACTKRALNGHEDEPVSCAESTKSKGEAHDHSQTKRPVRCKDAEDTFPTKKRREL